MHSISFTHLLLLASVVASSVSTLSVSTSSITASVISSVVVITIIVKVGTASSVGTALESQIFAINDKLVGLSFLTSEFSGFVLVDLLAFDDLALQHVLAVVSFSGSFWLIVRRWNAKAGHVLVQSELNFLWFLWFGVFSVFDLLGWVLVFSVVISNWSWLFGLKNKKMVKKEKI